MARELSPAEKDELIEDLVRALMRVRVSAPELGPGIAEGALAEVPRQLIPETDGWY